MNSLKNEDVHKTQNSFSSKGKIQASVINATILDKNCGKKEKSHILCSFFCSPSPYINVEVTKSLRPSVNQH